MLHVFIFQNSFATANIPGRLKFIWDIFTLNIDFKFKLFDQYINCYVQINFLNDRMFSKTNSKNALLNYQIMSETSNVLD